MLKHLLVPLDGSRLAESVLPAAACLARTLEASVTLVHVVEKNAPAEVHGEPHLGDAEQAGLYLEEVARRAFQPEVPIRFHVHTTGVETIAGSIVEHGGEFETDLIVMCAHGQGGMRDFFVGNIAQQVIARGRMPVLVFRPEPGGSAPAFSCRSFLVPLDGQAPHESGIGTAYELARACGAALHLVTVVQTWGTLAGQWISTGRFMPGATSEMLDMAVQNAEEYLRGRQEELQKKGGMSSVSVDVVRGDPASAIADAALRLEVDLIVLSTHRKAGSTAFWSGSVTPKVCKLCRMPLLLVPVSGTE